MKMEVAVLLRTATSIVLPRTATSIALPRTNS